MCESDTASVTIAVTGFEPAMRDGLEALASAELLIDGVAIEIRGMGIMRTGPRSFGLQAPMVRDGLSAVPGVVLPRDLAQALADTVLAEYEALRRASLPPAPVGRAERRRAVRQ